MSIELRQHIEKTVPLTNEEFEQVLFYFKEKHFKKHQIVIHEGSYVPYNFYIVKGLMKSSYTNPEGKEYILQFALEDWWITDPEAFHNQTKATLNIDCLEDTKVFALSLENKEKLCKELSKMERFFQTKQRKITSAYKKEFYALLAAQHRNVIAIY